MFDPNMMNSMSEMMKNPDMVKQMEEMMKNPDIMSNAMNMMNDPSMANLFGGAMPNLNQNDEENTNEQSKQNDENNNEQNTNEEERKFSVDAKIRLINLKSETYNGQECVVKRFDSSSNRYNVLVTSLNKEISVKEENLENNDDIVVEVD